MNTMIDMEEDRVLEAIQPDSMTAMIDVVFSLLAFMMLIINTPLVSMPMDLPQTNRNQTQKHVLKQQMMILTVLGDSNSYRLNESGVLDQEQLRQKLRAIQAKDEFKIIINTDKSTEVQRMIDAFSILAELSLNNVEVAIKDSH